MTACWMNYSKRSEAHPQLSADSRSNAGTAACFYFPTQFYPHFYPHTAAAAFARLTLRSGRLSITSLIRRHTPPCTLVRVPKREADFTGDSLAYPPDVAERNGQCQWTPPLRIVMLLKINSNPSLTVSPICEPHNTYENNLSCGIRLVGVTFHDSRICANLGSTEQHCITLDAISGPK